MSPHKHTVLIRVVFAITLLPPFLGFDMKHHWYLFSSNKDALFRKVYDLALVRLHRVLAVVRQ